MPCLSTLADRAHFLLCLTELCEGACSYRQAGRQLHFHVPRPEVAAVAQPDPCMGHRSELAQGIRREPSTVRWVRASNTAIFSQRSWHHSKTRLPAENGWERQRLGWGASCVAATGIRATCGPCAVRTSSTGERIWRSLRIRQGRRPGDLGAALTSQRITPVPSQIGAVPEAVARAEQGLRSEPGRDFCPEPLDARRTAPWRYAALWQSGESLVMLGFVWRLTGW